MFVLGKAFQPSLIFGGEAGAYLSEVNFWMLHSRVGSRLSIGREKKKGKGIMRKKQKMTEARLERDRERERERERERDMPKERGAKRE